MEHNYCSSRKVLMRQTEIQRDVARAGISAARLLAFLASVGRRVRKFGADPKVARADDDQVQPGGTRRSALMRLRRDQHPSMGMGMLGDPNLAHPLTGQKDGPAHLRTKVCYALGLEGCDFVVLADWALKSDGTFGHVGSESCISPVHVLERPFIPSNAKLPPPNLANTASRIPPPP